ncbi:MAG: hypothetical protein DSY91_02545 [Deltaproteobacteria bacterium]|nr:MAG: hypothetical protein DSY91_02545 [Deltaproteobacteria bacterium]
MEEDKRNIRLLAIFHYVMGGLTGLFACMPLIHLFIGIAVLKEGLSKNPSGGPSPELVGWIFIIVAVLLILAGWTLAVLMIIAGRKLSKFKSRTFCLVIGAIECALIPIGTILGVFTLILLTKDSVKDLFTS